MTVKYKILQLMKFKSDKGATESEAASALAMANKLMTKHNLTEEDLYAAQSRTDMKKDSIQHKEKHLNPAYKLCASSIERLCGVQIWKSNEHIEVFGFINDVDLAVFLLQMLKDSMAYTWSIYKKENSPLKVSEHKAYWSFRYGFAREIRNRVDQLMQERLNVASSGVDLVALKDVVVEDGLRQMFPYLRLEDRQIARNTKLHRATYESGKNAGSGISLSRPIEA